MSGDSWGGSTADDRERAWIELSLSDALGDDQLADWQRVYLQATARGTFVIAPPGVVVTGGRRAGKSIRGAEAWSAYLEAHERRSAALRRRRRLRAVLRHPLAALVGVRRLRGLLRHPVVTGTGILALYVLLLVVAVSSGA